jgi:hypothetical protein
MVKKKEERSRKKDSKKTRDEVAVTVETATVTVTGKTRFVLKNGYARTRPKNGAGSRYHL